LEHQRHMLVEALGDAARASEVRYPGIDADALDGLDTALDLAQRREVIVDLPAIGRAERACEAREILADRVEDAAVLMRERHALLGGAAVAEQALEDEPRIILGRQRLGRRSPRERVEVYAAVAVLALSGQEIQIDRELERRQHGVAAEHSCCELIG